MDRMLYVGMSGAKQAMEQQASTANNMANASTPGFRAQINAFRPGLLKVVLSRADGTPRDEPAPSTASPECTTAPIIRKAGVMAVVERGGDVLPGQPIAVSLPETPHLPLEPV